MKDLPVVAKLIVNIILYIVYWAIVCFIVGVCMYIFVGGVDNTLADKIAIFSALVILLVTLFFRKYFYIQGEIGVKNIYKAESKTEEKKSDKKSKKKIKETLQQVQNEDDDIKIYVDKEIK